MVHSWDCETQRAGCENPQARRMLSALEELIQWEMFGCDNLEVKNMEYGETSFWPNIDDCGIKSQLSFWILEQMSQSWLNAIPIGLNAVLKEDREQPKEPRYIWIVTLPPSSGKQLLQ